MPFSAPCSSRRRHRLDSLFFSINAIKGRPYSGGSLSDVAYELLRPGRRFLSLLLYGASATSGWEVAPQMGKPPFSRSCHLDVNHPRPYIGTVEDQWNCGLKLVDMRWKKDNACICRGKQPDTFFYIQFPHVVTGQPRGDYLVLPTEVDSCAIAGVSQRN